MKDKLLFICCYIAVWFVSVIIIIKNTYTYFYADYVVSLLCAIAFSIIYSSIPFIFFKK